MSTPGIKGWKDGEKHYCPCNGRCHTEMNPCSFDCVGHHHLIILEGDVKPTSICPGCKRPVLLGETVIYDENKREYHSLCYLQPASVHKENIKGATE